MIPADLKALVIAGLSDAEIADKLGVSARTVQRWRKRAGLPSMWTPQTPPHGTRSRYRRGCVCDDCRAANARAHLREIAVFKALTRRAERAYEPWTAEDDAIVLDSSMTVVERAQKLQRTYEGCTQRLALLRRQEALTA